MARAFFATLSVLFALVGAATLVVLALAPALGSPRGLATSLALAVAFGYISRAHPAPTARPAA